MSEEQWGPWIEHGRKMVCPVPAGTWVMVDHIKDGVVEGRVTNITNWSSVYRYRIRKPRALLDMIERASELDNSPEGPVRAPISPKVDAPA